MAAQQVMLAELLARGGDRKVSARVQRRKAWIAFFVNAAAAKEAASKISDEATRNRLVAYAETSISDAMDGYCGTPGSRKPGPHRPLPGPPAGLNSLVTQLTILSNAFPEGTLRRELGAIAGGLLARGMQSVSAFE